MPLYAIVLLMNYVNNAKKSDPDEAAYNIEYHQFALCTFAFWLLILDLN